MSSGVCATVSDGDVLLFEWNPAFDTSAIAGLLEANLRFTLGNEIPGMRRSQPALLLHAMPQRGRGEEEHPFTSLPNGYFRMRFRLDLANTQPGEYRLVEAQFVPARAESTSAPEPQATRNPEPTNHPEPQATNNPARSSFCLNVVAAPPRRGR